MTHSGYGQCAYIQGVSEHPYQIHALSKKTFITQPYGVIFISQNKPRVGVSAVNFEIINGKMVSSDSAFNKTNLFLTVIVGSDTCKHCRPETSFVLSCIYCIDALDQVY